MNHAQAYHGGDNNALDRISRNPEHRLRRLVKRCILGEKKRTLYKTNKQRMQQPQVGTPAFSCRTEPEKKKIIDENSYDFICFVKPLTFTAKRDEKRH